MATESDRLIVQQIRTGGEFSESAWTELVDRYEGRLRAYVRRRLNDHSLVDDVVQETFVGFLNSIANFDENRDLQSWLFTIAAHKVTDQLRKKGRQRYLTATDNDSELGSQSDSKQRAASSIARGKEQLDLEASALARSLSTIIHELMRKGDYQRVQVLELLFVKSWPNNRVAAFLGISEQQVANFRFAAVRKLSADLQGAGLPGDLIPSEN